jgi:hypothetical protein
MSYEWAVDEDLTLSDSEKPRYLLPEGCQDLNDVIRLQEGAAGALNALKKHSSVPAADTTIS